MPKPFHKDSPSPESTESESEEISPQGHSSLFSLASQITSSFGSGPSKRRLPGGSAFAAASNARDAKSRKREDGPGGPRRNIGLSGGSGSGWAEGKERRDKDDLVDIPLAERFREGVDFISLVFIGSHFIPVLDFGDPFLETEIVSSA